MIFKSIKPFAFAVLLGAICGLGNAYLISKLVALQTRIHQSPPIAVIDIVKVVASYPIDAKPEEVEKRIAHTQQSILRLKEAGYLVLDASAVLSAPADIYLNSEVVQQ